MRVKLSILAGAVAFTITGIAVAGQGKAFFSSSVNPLSTISDMVSTSLWGTSTNAATPAVDDTKAKRISVESHSSQILRNISSTPAIGRSTYASGQNYNSPDYSTINTNPSVIEYGYSGNESVAKGDAGNSFSGGLGGGSNWGSQSRADNGGLYYYPGFSFGGGLSPTVTPSTWTLSSTGVLTYSVAGGVPAVPEPGEWLFMLLGFGLIGFVANFRKQEVSFS